MRTFYVSVIAVVISLASPMHGIPDAVCGQNDVPDDAWRASGDSFPLDIPSAPEKKNTLFDHGTPDTYEQYMLELINRARANPTAEAIRWGLALNAGLEPDTISAVPKQPLAWHPRLAEAARGHTHWMLDNNVFSHTGANNSSALDRMTAAGYPFANSWAAGENLAWVGSTSNDLNLTASVLELHANLFHSPGHRENMLNDGYDEVGLDITVGGFTQNTVTFNAVMTTHNFAFSGGTPGPLLVGVVYEDHNGDGMYSPGEGIGGVRVEVSNSVWHAVTAGAGGYAVPLPDGGAHEVVYSLNDVILEMDEVQAAEGRNIKRDLLFQPESATRIVRLEGALAFGSVQIGDTAELPLGIVNLGNEPLTVTGLDVPEGFSGNWSGSVPAGGRRNVPIRFTPETARAYSGVVLVHADSTSGVNHILCSGTGIASREDEQEDVVPDDEDNVDQPDTEGEAGDSRPENNTSTCGCRNGKNGSPRGWLFDTAGDWLLLGWALLLISAIRNAPGVWRGPNTP